MFRELARIARREGCGRMDWTCLDRNEPGIRLYRSLGARSLEDWTIYRLNKESLEALAGASQET